MSEAVDEAVVERIEVARTIKAAPSAIFAVLRDPEGHVSIDASGMLMGSTGEPASKVGDTFEIHMDREALNDFPLGEYDVTIDIVTYEQDREIAWTIQGLIKPPIGHVYGYRLEPTDEATETTTETTTEAATETATIVTSYYDWSSIDPVWRERAIFPVIPESALRATLGILARTVARNARS